MANESSKQDGMLPKFGGYQNLRTYKRAEIIYDGTVYFTKRFFGKYDRTKEQMIQAARSGKQNIVEGSMASGTSKEMEIKLTNVARASLEELKIDYEDFLRTHNFMIWGKDHKFARRLQELSFTKNADYNVFKKGIENDDPGICANVLLGLIKITSSMLYRQIKTLEKEFLLNGGIRERMFKARRSK